MLRQFWCSNNRSVRYGRGAPILTTRSWWDTGKKGGLCYKSNSGTVRALCNGYSYYYDRNACAYARKLNRAYGCCYACTHSCATEAADGGRHDTKRGGHSGRGPHYTDCNCTATGPTRHQGHRRTRGGGSRETPEGPEGTRGDPRDTRGTGRHKGDPRGTRRTGGKHRGIGAGRKARGIRIQQYKHTKRHCTARGSHTCEAEGKGKLGA